MLILRTITLFAFLMPGIVLACGEMDFPGGEEQFNSIDEILNCLPGSTDPRLSYNSCDRDQGLMNESSAHALRMTNDLLRNFRRIRQSATAQRGNIDRAIVKLECALGKLDGGTIHCKDLGGDLGRAIRFIGNGIAIDPQGHRNTHQQYSWTRITLAERIGSTILHEMTHKCGTGDADYFESWSDDLLSGGPNWWNVADTYQNMALFGFCVPGPECAQRPAPRK